MNQDQAEKVKAEIDAWWQRRRECFAMSTEEHNREFAQVEELKEKIDQLVEREGGEDAPQVEEPAEPGKE